MGRAVAVTAGKGSDSVPEGEWGVVRSVPDDHIKLRLLNGISEKYRKYQQYLKNGVVKPTEPYVVAINAAMVPSARRELDIPRIVRAVFPFGFPAVTMNRLTAEIVDRYYRHEDEVEKEAGASVPTDFFLSEESAGISALIYSCVDACNRPKEPWTGLMIVHNPQAARRLEIGCFPCDREYWMEGKELRWKDRA